MEKDSNPATLPNLQSIKRFGIFHTDYIIPGSVSYLDPAFKKPAKKHRKKIKLQKLHKKTIIFWVIGRKKSYKKLVFFLFKVGSGAGSESGSVTNETDPKH